MWQVCFQCMWLEWGLQRGSHTSRQGLSSHHTSACFFKSLILPPFTTFSSRFRHKFRCRCAANKLGCPVGTLWSVLCVVPSRPSVVDLWITAMAPLLCALNRVMQRALHPRQHTQQRRCGLRNSTRIYQVSKHTHTCTCNWKIHSGLLLQLLH